MLAGNMKLKNFLLILLGLGAAGGTAVFALGGDSEDKEEGEEPSAPVVSNNGTKPSVTPDPEPVRHSPEPVRLAEPIQPEATPPNDSLREVDRALMGFRGKDLGTKKSKDAIKGHSWKINLYQDEGVSHMNRAKVDLDRDDQWDEKWTFDGENIARKVSPNDDEDYSQEYDWNGSDWVAR